jgi:type II restriction enzyme
MAMFITPRSYAAGQYFSRFREFFFGRMRMPEVSEAQAILTALRMPSAKHNEIAALTLLALCVLKSEDRWSSAQQQSLTVTKGIIHFIRDVYGGPYAPNTRETFRRQVLHQFV